MNPKDSANGSKRVFYFVCFAIFLFMLLMNILTPYIADDYRYSRSASLGEVFYKEYIHYHIWGGRSVVHLLARIFLLMPKLVFNLANAAMYTLLTLLLYRYAALEKRYDTALLLLTHLLLWLFVPSFGQTVFWLDGACNYLWGTTIALAFLYPYFRAVTAQQQPALPWWKLALTFIGGIIAGWTNELSAAACLVLMTLTIGYLFLTHKKRSLMHWMLAGFAGVMAGFLMMILAPGNAVRGENFPMTASLIATFGNRLIRSSDALRSNFCLLLILNAAVAAIQWLRGDQKRALVSGAFCLAAFAGVYSLVLAPSFSGRTLFPAAVLLILSLLHGIVTLPTPSQAYNVQALRRVLCAMLLVPFALTAVPAVVDTGWTYLQSIRRDQYVIAQREAGQRDIVVPKMDPAPRSAYNAMYGLSDLSDDTGHWINEPYAEMFGVDTVRAIPRTEWLTLTTGRDPTPAKPKSTEYRERIGAAWVE